MYATAHHVKSPKGQTGINAFLHEHGEDRNATSWETPSVAAVADARPGTLIAESYDVPPGGNAVMAFLDVVAVDGIGFERLSGALDIFGTMVASQPAPIVATINGVGMRFGCDLGLAPVASKEFDRLKNRVFEILHAERTVANSAQEPLDVLVVFAEDGYAFELSPRSAARVREAHRAGEWEPARFHVDPDVMMDFQDMYGDLVPHIVSGLTNLRLEKVIAMGGVRLVNRATLKEIRRWPRAGKVESTA
jgi:hypothetical protein